MEHENYTNFIRERIYQLREMNGISARELSLSLGYSSCYINKIENGNALPSITALLYICEYFDLSPKEFFGTLSENKE